MGGSGRELEGGLLLRVATRRRSNPSSSSGGTTTALYLRGTPAERLRYKRGGGRQPRTCQREQGWKYLLTMLKRPIMSCSIECT
ncbi:hypothetical protein F7725_027127, partial [Dissostichus mawsoni]